MHADIAADIERPFRAVVQEAVDLVGGQAELGRRMGKPHGQGTVWWLLNGAENVSAELAVAIHRATEGRVPKHRLRPDLFDPPAPLPAEAAE